MFHRFVKNVCEFFCCSEVQRYEVQRSQVQRLDIGTIHGAPRQLMCKKKIDDKQYIFYQMYFCMVTQCVSDPFSYHLT